jgi:tape measure domain-containing protein
MGRLIEELVVRYTVDKSALSIGLKQVKSELADVSSAASKSGDGLLSGFRKAGGGLLDFGAKVGLTIDGVKSLADGVVGFGKALLGPNAQMEQTTVGFETLLGKGKKTQDFLRQLQQFAAATPFEFPELATDAEHMLAFGFAAKDVIPYLTNIGDAMGAMGKSNAEIDHMVEIFGQMHAAGKLNAGDMMQISSMGIPAWKMLADAMHKTVPEVQKLSADGLIPADNAIKAISDGMHKMFGGGMEAESKTFLGLWSTVKDNISEALRVFTGPLFEAAKKGIEQLGNLVSSKAFQDFAANMGKKMGDVFSLIAQKSREALPYLQRFLPSFQGIKTGANDAFQMLQSTFGQLESVLGPPLQNIGDIIGGTLKDDFDFALKEGKGLSSWFGADMVPALQKAAPGFQHFGDVLLNDVAPALANAWSKMHDLERTALAVFIPLFEKATPLMVQFGAAVYDKIGSALQFVTPYFNSAVGAIDHFGQELGGRALEAVNAFFSGLEQMLPFFQAVWEATWAAVGSELVAGWRIMSGAVQVAWNVLSGIVITGLDVLEGHWTQVWVDIKEHFVGVWNGMQNLLSGFLKLFGFDIGTFGQIATGHMSDMKKNVSDQTNQMKNNIIQNLTDMRIRGLDQTTTLTWQAEQMFSDMGTQVGIDMSNMDTDAKNYWNDIADYITNHPISGSVSYTQGSGAPLMHNAEGTDYSPGGLSWVGERGPEIIDVPRGSKIFDHNKSMKMASGNYPIQTSSVGGSGVGSSSSGGSSGGGYGQHVTIVEIDGQVMARIVNKHTDRIVRVKLGGGGRAT